MSVPKKILEYLKALPDGESAAPWLIAGDIGASQDYVRSALTYLHKRGLVERPEPGQYRYLGDMVRAKPTRLKIYRAIHAAGQFGTADIALLSGGERSYCRAVIRRLIKSGDVERLGKVADPDNGCLSARFRVRNPDDYYLKYVLRGHHGETRK